MIRPMIQSFLRRLRRLPLVLILFGTAMPAHAEKLTFDHRHYPALKAVLDGGDTAMIAYNAANPRYVVDLIAIKGKSASDWSEAIEIIARTPSKNVGSAQAWFNELRARSDRLCPNTVTQLPDEPNAITFERRSANCPAERAQTAIARVIGGNRSLFLLTFLFKGTPDEQERQQALALLASAHLD